MSDLEPVPTPPVALPRAGIRLTTLMLWVLVVGGGLGLLIRGVYRAREAARVSQCQNNLKQIGIALHNYHQVHDCFPPAYIADAAGKPMHSWRVLISPFMESGPFYNSYNLAEPWDGPNNRRAVDRYAPIYWYECPSRGARRGLTSYVMIVGPETASPGVHSIRLGDIRDGAGRTILVAEVANVDIPWAEPRDLDASSMSWTLNDPSRPSISSQHDRRSAVLFADGSIQRLDSRTPPATLRAMTTIAGGEAVDPEELR